MPIKIITRTSFGPVALIWSMLNGSPRIIRILLNKTDSSLEEQLLQKYPHSKISSTSEVDAVAQDINAFLQGKDIIFSLDLLDMQQCSQFQKNVLLADYRIPRGKVCTYKTLAKRVGKEKGARAVGNVLANNPFPLIIPCHRVIRSDGQLGGFQGGVNMKRALLENEGINFDVKGRVACNSIISLK